MAKNRQQAIIEVYINGEKQANNKLEEMKRNAEKVKNAIEEMRMKQASFAGVNQQAYDALDLKIQRAIKAHKELSKSIRDTEQEIYAVEKKLGDVSGLTERTLRSEQKTFKQRIARSVPSSNVEDMKRQEYDAAALVRVTEELERRRSSVLGYTSVFSDIENAADKSLSTIKQRLQDLIVSTKQNTQEIEQYKAQLAKVEEEQQRRTSTKAGRVMGNLSGSSVSEIQEAIRVTVQLRDAQKLGGQEWEIYNEEILRAQKYLLDFNELGKRLAMADRMQDLAKVSASSLGELRKYWQEQVDGAEKGSQELAEYERHLKSVRAEEDERMKSRAISVVDNLDGSSVSEIQETVRMLEQLRDSTSMASRQWLYYNENIKEAKKYLQEYADADKRSDVAKRMGKIGTASDKSLVDLKKFWQEQIDSTDQASQSLQQYQQQLQVVIDEENRRISERAKTTLGQVQTGTFDGTIVQSKEAIKLLEQYKQSLKLTDTKGIQEVESAMQVLNERIKQASASTLSLQEALIQADKVGKDSFDGTYDDLQLLKNTLEDYKKSLKINDVEGLKKIEEALTDIQKAEIKATNAGFDLDKVLGNIKGSSLEDLQKSAALLQQRLSVAADRTGDYIKQSAKLRQVNVEIDKIKNGWKQHDNQIVATMKRLASYVLVYAGFNEVWGRMKQLFSDNLGLSDSLADIQKTTGLSAESVAELSREIDSLDTRTAQLQLHELAASAGQAGLKTKEDVLGFVRAADQLSIALNELGEDGVNTLLKISNLTGEGKLLGTEKSLLAIGSSINELSAASAATAGPITDIISRIGSIGSISKLSMADMAALGATLDELGQEAEVSGTALTTFITALQTNTRGIAMAIGLDDKELDRMMKGGQTMEAIIMVLEKLGRMGGDEGMKALAPVLKEFGSDGERLNRVLATLSKNTDTLRARVDLSREAYAEATSVTEEAMVKQESAIGILNRLGNELKETFVNSGVVDGIKNILLLVTDFVGWLKRGSDGVISLTSIMAGLTAAFIANTVAVKTGLKEMTITAAWVKARAAVATFASALFQAKTYTDLLAKSWKALSNLFKTNWIGLLATGVTAVAVAVAQFTARVSEAAKAMADYNSELDKEQARMDALFEGAKKANDNIKEKRDLIREINSRYGEYLGFMLSEVDGNDKLAAAQERVNAKIRERLALQLKEKMENHVSEEYAGRIQESSLGIRKNLEQNNGVTEVRAGETTRMVQGIVKKNISQPMETILSLVRKELEAKFNTESSAHGSAAYFDIKGDLEDYIEAQKEYRKALEITASEAKEEMSAANEEMMVANDKVLNSLMDEWNELQKVKTDVLDEKQLSEHNAKLEKVAKGYVKVANEQLKLVTDEQKTQLESHVKYFDEAMVQMEKTAKKAEPNIWGYGHTMEEASVDQLVAKYKQLFDERKTMREDADYTTAYAKEFADRNQAMDWYLEKLKEIEKQLNKMGYDTSGNFLKNRKSGTRGQQKEMRDQINAAMASLEAYFLRRQQLIRQSYLDEQITSEEMNRQTDNMEEEYLLARVELRKKLLGQANTFDAKQYGMEGKDLDQLSGFLLNMGGDEADGMQKNLEKDLLEVQNIVIKYRQSIEQELLKYNPFESLANQFEESLDKLKLLSTDEEKIFRKSLGFDENIGQDEINRRVDALAELSESAYSMDETQLRSYLSNIDAVWAESMSPEQMSLLLKKLRDFYQDSKGAAETYAKDIKDMVDREWEGSGKEKKWSAYVDGSERKAGVYGDLKDLGLAANSTFLGTSEYDQSELDYYAAKAAEANEYYETMKNGENAYIEQAIAMGATELQARQAYNMAIIEAEKEKNNTLKGLSDKETEIQKNKLSSLKQYTDAVVDFGEQMGEAAFGEVADRKAAAKQLLQVVMKLTKDLIMQKVTELVMKKALGKQEVAEESTNQATITALHGTQAMTDLTVEGAATGAKTFLGIASGASKTIGELGWWGIPLIAVISAALSALMNMAMSKLNSAKAEVAAATGVSDNKGRVAAGMLTYAKGDYPVLGNDGKIYNASYQKELKTGVYGGGAHFGIFSEKKPEMIVDGDTTRKIMLNYPHIYDSILTIARHGQIKSAAMPTYATGNYPTPVVPVSVPSPDTGQADAANVQVMQTLSGVAAALNALTDRLNKPINATMNPYSANTQIKKADKFMAKRGLNK